MFYKIQEGFLPVSLWFSTWINIFNWNSKNAANPLLKENT